MSSYTISLNGNTSELCVEFFPPLELDQSESYECGLVYLKTFNSIPNVDKSNNLFHFGNNVIIIPEGTYEIEDIIRYLQYEMTQMSKGDSEMIIDMKANTNTSKFMIFSPKLPIYFNRENSVGSLFGFSPTTVLEPNIIHWSDKPIDILITNTIRVECSIVEGSFINNIPSHVIHEFSPTVPPGYQLIEAPTNIIYLPVKRNIIQRIAISLVNERGNLVNFRGENTSLRIHIRKVK